MISNNIPSNLGNLVAPFLPTGQRPVGQETAANRNSTFKPVEQPAKTAETRVRRKSEEKQRDGDGEERRALAEQTNSNPEQAQPETPSSRLAQRFAGPDAGHQPGSHFDQTI